MKIRKLHDLKFKSTRGPRHALHRVVAHLKEYEQAFVLSPDLWKAFPGITSLKWTEVRFIKSQKQNVPKQRGLYCFVVRPRAKPSLPPIGFPLYCGETGNTSSQNLNVRFGQYLREAQVGPRQSILYALTKWEGHLYFLYAVVPSLKRDLKKFESHLNDALIPPYVHEDFSAALRPAVAVYRKAS